jgi:hypothetical protein
MMRTQVPNPQLMLLKIMKMMVIQMIKTVLLRIRQTQTKPLKTRLIKIKN